MNLELESQKNKGIKYYKKLLLRNWKMFTIWMLVFIGLGVLFILIAPPQYLISSAIVVEAQPTPTDPSSNFSGGLTSVLSSNENLKNEGDVLRTRYLIQETVSALHLNIKMFSGSGIFSTEIYNEAPFTVKISKFRVDTLKKRDFKIEVISPSTIHVSNSDEKLDTSITFNNPVKTGQYTLLIEKKPSVAIIPAIYSTRIVSEDDEIAELAKNYDAEFSDKTTSAVDITLYYPNSKKGEVIIDHLMHQYLKDDIASKKRVVDSMLKFINSRIVSVGAELNGIEKNFEQYRSNNSIADLDEQSKTIVGNANNYYNQQQNQEIQLAIIRQLEKYLKDPSSKQVIPSSLSIQDASFTTALNDYNAMIVQRQGKLLSYTESSPIILNIDKQIYVARENLLQNIEVYKQGMELKSAQLGNQNALFNSSLKGVPGKQRAMLDYGRQQDLKQQLYMYLLQKREETALAKSSNIPTSRIIDPAKSTKEPAKPMKPLVFLLAGLLGFIVPFGYLNSKTVHKARINSEEDIENLTDISIIGKIGHSKVSNKILLENTTRSAITESFRTLRTKVQHILDSEDTKVIMVTSSVNGEGKTFISANLGHILAKADKKVLLMELDLRKPKLSGMFNYSNTSPGFSDFMDGSASIGDIIMPTELSENLFLITAGPIVSNASEMLMSKRTKHLIDSLKAQFDYIIIDSSPVGLVSDALIIEKYADMTIYICRHNYTHTDQIDIVNQLKYNDKVENMYLVINDVDFAKTGYFGYGYGLGYGETKTRRK